VIGRSWTSSIPTPERTHRAAFIDGSRRYPIITEDIDDEVIIDAVDAAYRAKYRGPGLTAVVSAVTRRYTMRVVPDPSEH